MQVPHVARRQIERGFDRFVEQAHRVVALEPRAQVVENLPRFLDGRLADHDAAEAARERLVFLDVFLVLAERGRRDHPDFAACEHRLEHVGRVRRRAERRAGADHRVRFVDEENQVRPFLELPDDVLNAILEHAAQHRAGDHRVHLQVDDLAVAQADRYRLGFELDAPRKAFGDRRLADPGLADQHHRVGALAVAEDLQHLLDFLLAAEHRGQFVLPREQVQVGGKVLQERRQLEPLLQPLFPKFHVTHARVQTSHEHLRLDTVASKDRHRDALGFFEDGGKQIGRLDGLPAGSARVMQRQLEDELGRRRHAQLASRKRRHHVEVLFDGLKNSVGVQFNVAHDLREHVPLDLRERQKDVFVGQQRMFPATGFLDRSVDNSLSGLAYLAR